MTDNEIRRLARSMGYRAAKRHGVWYVADSGGWLQTYGNGLDAVEVHEWLTQEE